MAACASGWPAPADPPARWPPTMSSRARATGPTSPGFRSSVTRCSLGCARCPARGGLGPPRGRGRAARRASRTAPVLAMPLADALGLAAAAGVAGRPGLPSAAYALAVLAILAATGQHRLRICLRVADQAGRILAAVAVPLPILLPWVPDGSPAWQVLWSAGLVVAFPIPVSAALRAAHRAGLLTEPAPVIGAATFP